MTTHVMIDNETMDTGPTAAIIQIGAVAFDPHSNTLVGEERKFERTINLQSSLMIGATISLDTVEWWKKQSSEARDAVCLGAKEISLVMADFVKWFNTLGKVEGVWSHGASFDIPQIEFALQKLNMKAPWAYDAVRDTRTVHWMAKMSNWEKPKRTTAHTALADAIAQATDIQSALARMNVHPF